MGGDREGGFRSDLSTAARTLRNARAYWPHIAAVFLVDLLAAPISLAAPLPVKIAVDSVLGDQPLPPFLTTLIPTGVAASSSGLLLFTAGLVLLIALGSRIQGVASSWLRTYTGERLVLNFRARLFHHAQRLSLRYHDSRGVSDTTYRILYDAPSIQYVAVDGFAQLFTAIITLVAMILVTASIDPALALVALVVAPVLSLLAWFYRDRLKHGWMAVHRLESDAFAVAQESFSALRVVKAFGQEDHERDRFTSRSQESIRAKLKVHLEGGAHAILVGVTVAAGTAAVLYVGVGRVQAGLLPLGSLLVVMAYVAQLYAPLQQMGSEITGLQKSLTMAKRAFTLLDSAPEVDERPGAYRLNRARGDVRFDRVGFHYDEGEPILVDASFDVPAGARVGIAGKSGTGKTTLLSLLTRLYDPSEGRISLDGRDLRDYRLGDLRQQFAIVLQDTVLFSVSIRENIAYAKPGASESEIVTAAEAAFADEFIRAMPDGYDTLVGERGMRLSGGERQRIALARAFLRDAPVLMLDEPTSSVDMRTEGMILDASERLMQGRTTFLVTHRLTALDHCDVLLVLNDGRISVVTAGIDSLIDRAYQAGGLEQVLG